MTSVKRESLSNPFASIVTVVLVLSPIIQTYGWGKYDFSFILTSLLSLVALAMGKIDLKKLPKYLLLYLVYWLIIHEISATNISEAIPLGVVKTILVFGMFFSIVKLPLLIKYYRFVVRISILFLFIQLLIKFLTGENFLGVFTFLPLAIAPDASSFFLDRLELSRLSSFFSEPAHFAQYIVPYLGILLFDNQLPKNKRIIEIIIVIAALLLLQSGNAVFCTAICLSVYLFYRMKGGMGNKIKATILVLILLAGAYAFSQTSIGESLMSRKEQVSINSVDELGYSTSGFERIFRGYYIYDEYSSFCKIIGNDNPEYKKTAANKSIYSYTFIGTDYLYCNTMQAYLMNTGVIGLIIMLLVYKNILEITNRCGKCILISFIAMNFLASSYFTEIMCLYLLLPTLMRQSQKGGKIAKLKENEKKSLYLY